MDIAGLLGAAALRSAASRGPLPRLAALPVLLLAVLGLAIARAAQTGTSEVFDASGWRLAAPGIGETKTLTVELIAAGAPAPFARLGQAVSVPLALATLGLAFLERRGRNGPVVGSDVTPLGAERRWRDDAPSPLGETTL